MNEDRRNRILAGIDIRHAKGLELGPLAWPLVRKDEGDITYVDHTTTEGLRQQYAHDPAVPKDHIVPVDAIWGDPALKGQRFDYIVAAHVVEHVPDLVGWLRDLTDVLTPEGEIRLVVPDRRFTFDRLRDETRLADVLVAHALCAKVPQPHLVLSQATQVVFNDTPPLLTPEAAAEWLETARRAAAGQYYDTHCWVFTPRSWARLMMHLTACGLLPYRCTMFEDTRPDSNEFIVGLRRGSGGWEQMAREAREDSVETRLRAEIAALYHSTSWRVTAPLRWMVESVRGN